MDQTHGQQALVFDFDTIQQRSLWELTAGDAVSGDGRPPAPVTRRFSGLLRTVDVLTQTLVLPDVQLLDGALFLHHGPEVVRSLLGRSIHDSLDIRVVGRDASLAECLRKMVMGSKESNTLATFEFSSMAVLGLNARELAHRVSRRASARLKGCAAADVPTVVAAEFEAASESLDFIEAPTGVFLAMANRWNAWITAFEGDQGTASVWDTRRFSMEAAFGHRPMPDGVAALVETGADMAAVVAEVEGLRGRSSLKARLAVLEPGLPPGTVGLLDAWWSSAYFDALAEQHKCIWLRLENTSAEAADMASSRASGTVTVQFEGSLIEIFSEMPSPTYASAKYSARNAIRKWAEAPVSDNSDGLAFAILKFSETLDRQETRHGLWVQILLTLVPGVLGAVIGHYVSTVAGIWALALTAVGILLAAPISDLLELHALRRKKMQSIINMPGGPHD